MSEKCRPFLESLVARPDILRLEGTGLSNPLPPMVGLATVARWGSGIVSRIMAVAVRPIVYILFTESGSTT